MERKKVLLCHEADRAITQIQDELENRYDTEVLCQQCAQIDTLNDTEQIALVLVTADLFKTLLTRKPLLCRRAGAIAVFHSQAGNTSDNAGLSHIVHLAPPYNNANISALLRHHWLTYNDSTALTANDLDNLQQLFRIGTFNVDLASGVATWSNTVNQLFGLPDDQQNIDFETFISRVHPEDREQLMRARQQALDGNAPLNMSHRVVHDDHVSWVWEYGELISDADGNACAFAGLVVDITQQRLLEEEVHHSTHYETLGQLVGGIAHNFNNLLTVIMGNADDLLYKFSDDTELAAQLQLVLNAGQRGAKIVRDLQEFAQQQSIEPYGVDTTELLGRLGQVLNISLGRNITIHYQLADSAWPVLIDPVKLENALVGLTLNAKEAMQGVGDITISSRNVDIHSCVENYPGITPANFVAITISDHGCGIHPDNLSRVTMPFFTTHKEQRSGLGLALADRFLGYSGGHLLIDSEQDKGTVVTVLIPRAEQVSSTKTKRPLSAQHRILVLLSDPVLRRNCCDYLVARQLIAEEAQNATAALDKLITHPDIALAIVGAPDSSQTLQISQALIERNANLQLLLLPPTPVELANLSRQITVLEDSEAAAHIVEKVEQLLGSGG